MTGLPPPPSEGAALREKARIVRNRSGPLLFRERRQRGRRVWRVGRPLERVDGRSEVNGPGSELGARLGVAPRQGGTENGDDGGAGHLTVTAPFR